MFLTILTRCYKRPTYLKKCIESVQRQTKKDFHQEFIIDEIGIGINETHKRFWTQDVDSDYVYVLDDDDILTDENFIKKLQELGNFDCCICQARIRETILPNKKPYEAGHIGTLNIVVSKKQWLKHRGSWGLHYQGDFDFIKAVVQDSKNIVFIVSVIAQTQKHSGGLREMKIGEQVFIKTGHAGIDFGFTDGETVTVTEKNMSFLECSIRGGLAEVIGEGFRTTDEKPNTEPKKNIDVPVTEKKPKKKQNEKPYILTNS
jgi:hypothetical protein